jgi:thiamine pyrophosphate-dependent acetolactate synthase large subunit-like protein
MHASASTDESVPVYRHLARRFRAEDVDTVFVLTGDGNMYWEAAFSELDGVRSVHVRHEHCALAMATAYARKTGRLGVASVTCGPGLTQTMTALTTAARARIPLLVYAGETPLDSPWNNQGIDQGPLVRATGAEYIAVHSLKSLPRLVSQAFYVARVERRPVVLAFPMDLQQLAMTEPDGREVAFSIDVAAPRAPRRPHPDDIAKAVARLRSSRRPVIVAGRGAASPEAVSACVALAEQCDAALATTLPVRGLFAGHPRSIGVCGGYAHPATKEAIGHSDVVVVVGASLTEFTTEYGRLLTPDKVVHVDEAPAGINHGSFVSSLSVASDAEFGMRALFTGLTSGGHRGGGGWDVTRYAKRVRTEPADSTPFAIEEDVLDPRQVIATLQEAIPDDWECVNGAGHSGYFATHMPDRPAARFLTIREFGAVGNGVSYAAGVAVARPDTPVVLFEGDGGVMMHAQELETLRRYGLKILVCVLNDGAFGSEVHKLRAYGLNTAGAVYGRNDIARMARGFGIGGRLIRRLDELPAAVRDFAAGDGAMLLDIQISDRVMSPGMNRRMTAVRPGAGS